MTDKEKTEKRIETAIKDIRHIFSFAYESFLTKISILITFSGGLPGLWGLFVVQNYQYPFLLALGIYVFCFLILGLYTLFRAFSKLSKKYIEECDMRDISHYETLHYLAELDAKHYGLQRKIYKIDSYIKEDGSCLSKHTTKLLAFANHISKIEHHQKAPSTPESSSMLNIIAEEIDSGEIKIIPNIVRQSYNTCYWELTFVPSLKKGEELKYSYEVNLLPGAFAMDFDTLFKRGLNFEYASATITYPTEGFQRRIIFPKTFIPPKMGYDVWIGSAQVRHTKEFIRIEESGFFRSGREDNCLYIELHMLHPIHGLQYVLWWTPPKK